LKPETTPNYGETATICAMIYWFEGAIRGIFTGNQANKHTKAGRHVPIYRDSALGDGYGRVFGHGRFAQTLSRIHRKADKTAKIR
jgi:ribosomal protein S5